MVYVSVERSSNSIAAFAATCFFGAGVGEFESVRALSEVRAAIGNARRYEKDLFLNMGEETETERYTALWTAELVQIRQAIALAQVLAQPAESALLTTMLGGVDGYAKGFNGLLGQLTRGELNDPWAANKAMTPLKAAMVEESAAGAISLAEETQHLRSAVSVFKLEQTTENSERNVPLALIAYA